MYLEARWTLRLKVNRGKGAGGGRVCVRVGLRGHDDDDELY